MLHDLGGPELLEQICQIKRGVHVVENSGAVDMIVRQALSQGRVLLPPLAGQRPQPPAR